MHSLGHSHVRRPAGPRIRSLTILQTQGLPSAPGRGHLSAGRSGRPCHGSRTLSLRCFLRLRSRVAWPESPPGRGLLLHNAGLWLPPTWKLCPLTLGRTHMAEKTCLSRKATQTLLGPPHHNPGA